MDAPTPYRRLNPDSPVVAYGIAADALWVAFNTGHRYRYTTRSVGSRHLREMIRLARAGRGLGTYIAQHLPRDGRHYDRKEPSGG